MRLIPVCAAFGTAFLLSGCDLSGDKSAKAANCFSVIPGNTTQPYSPIMVDACRGETWVMVRSPFSDKPEDGYTYNWYKMDRFAWPPSLVNK